MFDKTSCVFNTEVGWRRNKCRAASDLCSSVYICLSNYFNGTLTIGKCSSCCSLNFSGRSHVNLVFTMEEACATATASLPPCSQLVVCCAWPSHNLLLLILLRACEGLHCNSMQQGWPDYGQMRPCKADPPWSYSMLFKVSLSFTF